MCLYCKLTAFINVCETNCFSKLQEQCHFIVSVNTLCVCPLTSWVPSLFYTCFLDMTEALFEEYCVKYSGVHSTVLIYNPRQSQASPMFNSRLQTVLVVMFSRSLVYELASLGSKKFKHRFIRAEYPIPLFSHPILVLPCKMQSFHLILWSQKWFLFCNSTMETCFNQPSAHSAGQDGQDVQACSHFIQQLLTWFSCVLWAEKLQMLVLPWGGSSGTSWPLLVLFLSGAAKCTSRHCRSSAILLSSS